MGKAKDAALVAIGIPIVFAGYIVAACGIWLVWPYFVARKLYREDSLAAAIILGVMFGFAQLIVLGYLLFKGIEWLNFTR